MVLKFRGIPLHPITDEIKQKKLSYDGTFIYGFYNEYSDGTPVIAGPGFCNKLVKPETVGMSSGVKDFKRVEIYEGDICNVRFIDGPLLNSDLTEFAENSDHIGHVVYGYGQFVIINEEGLYYPLRRGCTNVTIIGNIYTKEEGKKND